MSQGGGGIDVLNLSFGPAEGGFDPDDPMQIATRSVYERGIPVVVAAGNSGPKEGTMQPLALAPWTISVGATDFFGEKLLDSSSRGIPDQVSPTVVSDGYSHLVIVGGPDFGPGTSFACGKVSQLAHWVIKCLELIAGNVSDLRQGAWSAQSRPIRLPVWGLADTGFDLRATDPWPTEVQSILDRGGDTVQLERGQSELDWYECVLSELDHYGLKVKPVADPDMVKHALQMMAKPMPQYKPHEVGAGFLLDIEVFKMFSSLTPSKFAVLFCGGISYAAFLTISEKLDSELGPLWDQQMVETTRTYFYYGYRVRVAKVI
ncbi:MAG: hypothetical protein A2580_04390 [Hydrogenophilales bacterium RIFOXYD1_FULL_62_11]|nr:MAG: hypothetical protein A2580_04390 [Hydrogenophilales bacterium RIFOXYD1_FULL_62_11]